MCYHLYLYRIMLNMFSELISFPKKDCLLGEILPKYIITIWLVLRCDLVQNDNADSAVHCIFAIVTIFIGPASDHCLLLSLTNWLTDSLTDSCLVNLIDVTLACEDANLKLVEVVTVADVDDVDCVENSLLQIWKLRFGHKAKLLFRL